MTPDRRHDGPEIEQDEAFQRREWRAQRIGRFVLLGIIILALAGAFGSGPLSSATVRTADRRLEADYHRIARHRSPAPLRVRVLPAAARDSIIDVWISQSYVHGLTVHSISPNPVVVAGGDDRLIYRFRLVGASRGMEIIFQADADDLWMRRGAIGLVGGDSIRFRQFVFP